jgi:hypothetical protein
VADAGFPGLTNLQTIGPVAPAGRAKPARSKPRNGDPIGRPLDQRCYVANGAGLLAQAGAIQTIPKRREATSRRYGKNVWWPELS